MSRSNAAVASRRFRTGMRAAILCALAAITATGLGAPGVPAAHADATGVPCLWAGNSHRQGQVVYAGGFAFSCHLDMFGNARWNKDGAAGHHSTVSSPGAIGNPAGSFSPGAWQPGTSYNDYCVGNQLIAGSSDIYSAVTDNSGTFLYWRSVGPISWWSFDSGVRPPSTSWRSSSLCQDGALT